MTVVHFTADAKFRAPGVVLRQGWSEDNVVLHEEANAIRDAALNVKLMRVLGNGIQDETTYFNEVAAEGKVVMVPAGTYLFSDKLDVAAGGVIRGIGAPESTILRFAGTPTQGTRAIRLNGVGAGIESCTIEVTAGEYWSAIQFRASRTFLRNCIIRFTTPNVHAADFTGFAGAYILYASETSSIDTDVMNDIIIENNDITAEASSGVGLMVGDIMQIHGCPRVRIENNYIHDVVSVGSTFHNWSIYCAHGTPGKIIRGNECSDNTGIGGIHCNADVSAGGDGADYGSVVEKNDILDCSFTGIGVDSHIGARVELNTIRGVGKGINILTSSAVVVGRNHIGNMVDGVDVGDVNYPFLTINSDCADCIVESNTLEEAGDCLVGMQINAPRTTVDKNKSVSSAGPHLFATVSGGATGSSFTKNTRVSVAGDSTKCVEVLAAFVDFSGNNIEATCTAVRYGGDNGVIERNTITVTGGGNNCLFLPSGGDNNFVTNNNLTTAANGVVDSGAGNTIHHNVVNGKPTHKNAIYTGNGDGVATDFVVTHGLSNNPVSGSFPQGIVITPMGSDLAGLTWRVSAGSGTTFTVKFSAAPALGTGNVTFAWAGGAYS